MTETYCTCAHRDLVGRCRARPPTPMLLPVPAPRIATGPQRPTVMGMAAVTLSVPEGAAACGLWERRDDA